MEKEVARSGATPPRRSATPDTLRRHRRATGLMLLLCSTALALLSPSPASAQGPGDTYMLAPSPSRYGAAIDEARRILRAYMEESWAPGLSVAVAVDGETVWSEGMGYADLENRVPVTPLSKFRSGSIAKSITGTALARLWERGRIDLDAPVRRYVPEWPEKHPTITVRHLAHHTSGIRHYDPLGTEFFNRKRYTDIVDALELFADDSLLFRPGERYSYSTWGYNLLGAAIQGAADEPYPIFVDESVFEPLGMRSTVPDHSDTLIAHRVSFYERSGEGQSYHTRQSGWESERPTLLNGPFADNSNKWPGGGFLTNPEDLVRLGSALLEPGFLSAEGLELLFTPGRTNDGESVGYGLGWRIGEDDRGLRTIGHGGGAVGGTSDIVLYPDRGVVVALQVNKTDGGLGDLTNRIAWLFMEAGASSDDDGGASGADEGHGAARGFATGAGRRAGVAGDMPSTSAFPPQVSRSRRGAVVTQAPLATDVGARVLSRGGNAVDAAVATAFALAVVEPTNSGLGGRTQILVRRPDGSFAAIDGTTQVPSLYPADTVVGPDAGTGYGAVGVPGTVAALTRALREHGTWPLERALAPAIRLAEEGFPMAEDQARSLAGIADDLRRFEGSRRYFLKPGGAPYEPGERFVQTDLARTLRAIAEGGADAFYRGPIARRIAEDMGRKGGYLRAADLQAYQARDAVIVRGAYRDHELVGTYLPAAGANTIEILQIVDALGPGPTTGTPAWAAVMAQAVNLGFQDRLMDLARMGPPETFPLRDHAAEITSREWAERRAAEVRVPEAVRSRTGAEGTPPSAGTFPPGHTTHLSVADGEGGAVSLTQSLGPTLGSKVAAPGLGFAYAATMGYLSGEARSAGVRALGPGDRASSRQSPMMVLEDGELRWVLGGSGSRRIVSALAQVVSRVVDEGLSLEAAVEAPRVHVEPAEPKVVHVETGEVASWPTETAAFLREFGFEVRDRHDQSFGNVSAIEVDPETGLLTGVAEPRAHGSAGAPPE